MRRLSGRKAGLSRRPTLSKATCPRLMVSSVEKQAGETVVAFFAEVGARHRPRFHWRSTRHLLPPGSSVGLSSALAIRIIRG